MPCLRRGKGGEGGGEKSICGYTGDLLAELTDQARESDSQDLLTDRLRRSRTKQCYKIHVSRESLTAAGTVREFKGLAI